jgi:WD40 repeat protein
VQQKQQQQRTQASLAPTRLLEHAVCAVAHDPHDLSRVATAGEDAIVRVWRLRQVGEQLSPLAQVSKGRDPVFSPGRDWAGNNKGPGANAKHVAEAVVHGGVGAQGLPPWQSIGASRASVDGTGGDDDPSLRRSSVMSNQSGVGSVRSGRDRRSSVIRVQEDYATVGGKARRGSEASMCSIKDNKSAAQRRKLSSVSTSSGVSEATLRDGIDGYVASGAHVHEAMAGRRKVLSYSEGDDVHVRDYSASRKSSVHSTSSARHRVSSIALRSEEWAGQPARQHDVSAGNSMHIAKTSSPASRALGAALNAPDPWSQVHGAAPKQVDDADTTLVRELKEHTGKVCAVHFHPKSAGILFSASRSVLVSFWGFFERVICCCLLLDVLVFLKVLFVYLVCVCICVYVCMYVYMRVI